MKSSFLGKHNDVNSLCRVHTEDQSDAVGINNMQIVLPTTLMENSFKMPDCPRIVSG